MAKQGTLQFFCAFSVLILTVNLLCRAADEDRNVHIVYLGSLPEGEYSPLSHHLSLLNKAVQGSSPENLLVRSYKRSFNGFAAKLTDQEKEKLSKMKKVVSVFPSPTFQLHTTRSWDFMGFSQTIVRNPSVESDIIVGVIDSGIWPESFKDEGFGSPPKKWKGTCQGGTNFTCNNKLIGARYYITESAGDELGHGTHATSIAAGNAVDGASFFGLANGTARGGVPAARLAIYKVCSPLFFCTGEGVLAAFDDAIADGVDIISISMGAPATPLHEDPSAIGSFHAMRKGILTSQSAGFGNIAAVYSVAPWVLTVARSTIDRHFITKVVLGDGKTLIGVGINSFTLNGTSFPLIDGQSCEDVNHSRIPVKGKLVTCTNEAGDFNTFDSGVLGTILRAYGPDSGGIKLLPAAVLMQEEFNVAMSYIHSTRDPHANILKGETIKDPSAPKVDSWSARGPNRYFADIIKPDISAPGIDILAAYPIGIGIIIEPDRRRTKYKVMSGNSAACPHAAGAAAYVKTFHPDWSPEALKSSLMTTAWPMNSTDAEFAYGSGHLNPTKAVNPGLVYEASDEDYINLLCTVYDERQVRLISGDNSTCPTGSEKADAKDHNYPSMGAKVEPVKPFSVKFHRRVKNVGLANSTYKAKIVSNPKVDIKVVPEVLSFESLNEEKSFEVTVGGSGVPKGSLLSGALVWSDGIHDVKSPIVVHTNSSRPMASGM